MAETDRITVIVHIVSALTGTITKELVKYVQINTN